MLLLFRVPFETELLKSYSNNLIAKIKHIFNLTAIFSSSFPPFVSHFFNKKQLLKVIVEFRDYPIYRGILVGKVCTQKISLINRNKIQRLIYQVKLKAYNLNFVS
ncbi:hypothetical protein FEDK69T_29940 [Flavobacterium enshiense DK69]|nr:hypothetical protein FEDK69T_29940 [Flavobacterium enshiense DK69]